VIYTLTATDFSHCCTHPTKLDLSLSRLTEKVELGYPVTQCGFTFVCTWLYCSV